MIYRRTGEERRLWRDWATVRIGYPKSLKMNDLINLYNNKRRTGNPKFFRFRADVSVNCVKICVCDLCKGWLDSGHR